MTSPCVDASSPVRSRRRDTRQNLGEASPQHGGFTTSRSEDRHAAVSREWDALIASALEHSGAGHPESNGDAAQDSVQPAPATASFSRTSLPPGVVDTRPHGTRIIDLRDGVQLVDGVFDTRPSTGALGLNSNLESPVSPFATAAELSAPPAGDAGTEPAQPFLLDAQTKIVRRRRDVRAEAAAQVEIPAAPEPMAPVVELAPAAEPVAVVAAVRPSTGAPTGRGSVRVPLTHSPSTPSVPPAPRAEAASPYLRRSELRRLEARASRRRPSGSLSVPQVGIASALGLATIAAPLTGALSAPGQPGVAQLDSSIAANRIVIAAAPAVQAAPFPQTVAQPVNALSTARLVADDSQVSSVPGALAAPSRVLVSKATTNGESAVLPGCDGVVPAAAKTASNGNLPASALCTLWQKDQKLRADAAVSLARLNVAFKQDLGKDLCVTDSYRTLSDQFQVKRLRGGWAAAPGTSEHGLGTAIDLCGGSAVKGTSTYTWLRANGARYGWSNPDWAQTTLPEPWHFEYHPS